MTSPQTKSKPRKPATLREAFDAMAACMRSAEKLAPIMRQKGNSDAPLSKEAIESVVVICLRQCHC